MALVLRTSGDFFYILGPYTFWGLFCYFCPGFLCKSAYRWRFVDGLLMLKSGGARIVS